MKEYERVLWVLGLKTQCGEDDVDEVTQQYQLISKKLQSGIWCWLLRQVLPHLPWRTVISHLSTIHSCSCCASISSWTGYNVVSDLLRLYFSKNNVLNYEIIMENWRLRIGFIMLVKNFPQVPRASLSSVISTFLPNCIPHLLCFSIGCSVSMTLTAHDLHATCLVTFNPSHAWIALPRYKSIKGSCFIQTGIKAKLSKGNLAVFPLLHLLYKILIGIIYSYISSSYCLVYNFFLTSSVRCLK